jgi:putative tryptophan/tyrosine transport system substrate-binding protein
MATDIGRRQFISAIGGSAFAWPLAVRAQQPPMPVIGWLNSTSSGGYADRVGAFQQGLAESGYVEGRNVTIEFRWADGANDRLPAMAADLVNRKVTVIAANGAAAVAAKAATASIPIIFTSGDDPVRLGLVASLNRPGGNLTGVVSLDTELLPKRLQLLHELIPAATVIAALLNPANAARYENLTSELNAAAAAMGLQIKILRARTDSDFDGVFATLLQLRAAGLVIGTDAFFNSRTRELAALALRHAVPTIYQYRDFAAAGGLISYGGSGTDTYRQAGVYAGRILKGERPTDLPVQESTKVELFINTKTAKTLGITIPLSLLGRADEVIE